MNNSILIIANPTSGSYNKHKLATISKLIENNIHPSRIDTVLTEYKGHATIIAKESDADIIIAVGGDGHINEVAKGVLGSNKIFSAIPFGTANIFCQEYGIDSNPIKAAKKLDISNIISIPVGYIGDDIFLLMAGFGFDANTCARVDIASFPFFKKLKHIVLGIPSIFKDKYSACKMYSGENEIIFYHAIVAIANNYAGVFKLSKHKVENALSVYYIDQNSKWLLLKSLIKLFIYRKGYDSKFFSTQFIKIEGPKAYQLDGDFKLANNSSFYLMVKPGALKVAISK